MKKTSPFAPHIESRCRSWQKQNGDDKLDYFNLYKAVWQWHKRNSKVEDSDEYWQQVLAEGDEIQKKYNCQFATDLMMTVISELERKGKELRERECDRGG